MFCLCTSTKASEFLGMTRLPALLMFDVVKIRKWKNTLADYQLHLVKVFIIKIHLQHGDGFCLLR